MKRHENLKLAILAWVAAVIFLVIGFWLQFNVSKPILSSTAIDQMDELSVWLYTFMPLGFIAFMALFAILGLYFFYCEFQIEHGQYIESKVIKVITKGKSTIISAWSDGKKTFTYRLKGVDNEKAKGYEEKGRITLRVSKSDPRLHYFAID